MEKIFIIIALLIPAIVVAGQYSKPKEVVVAKEKKDLIEVYNGPTAPKPFIVIGEIHVKGSTEKMVISKMKSVAQKKGADAILSYSLDNGNFPSYWTGAVLSNGKGIAVRWAAEGEKGITKITDNLSIPVIQ